MNDLEKRIIALYTDTRCHRPQAEVARIVCKSDYFVRCVLQANGIETRKRERKQAPDDITGIYNQFHGILK